MDSDILIIFVEFLVVLVVGVPNVILFLVAVGYRNKEIDMWIISIISIFDLLCTVSLFLEAVANATIHVFGLDCNIEQAYILNNSVISMPGAMLGVSLAGILSVVRCMAIVFQVRVKDQIIYLVILALAVYIFTLCGVSYFIDDRFYGDKLLLRVINPSSRWSWYTCSDIVILSLSILAIVISYIFIIQHYYSLRHMCEIQGIYLRGTIIGIVIAVILYILVILPRIVMTFLRQLNPAHNYERIGQNCFLILYGLPAVNAIFSLLLHEETRRQALAIFKPNPSRMFQAFVARASTDDQSSLVA